MRLSKQLLVGDIVEFGISERPYNIIHIRGDRHYIVFELKYLHSDDEKTVSLKFLPDDYLKFNGSIYDR